MTENYELNIIKAFENLMKATYGFKKFVSDFIIFIESRGRGFFSM